MKVSARVAHQMAHDFFAWEKRRGYTTAYRVTYCRGYLSAEGARMFPTWGVRAFCRTYRKLGDGRGQVWDLFTVYDERVGRLDRRRCRLWGSTFFTEIGDIVLPDHYVYRRCP